MDRYLVCDNPKCRYILDGRINGKTFGKPQLIVKKCPECGGNWSAVCPSCSQPLQVRLVAGMPRSSCCQPKAKANAQAA